jgi:hypothetical protein
MSNGIFEICGKIAGILYAIDSLGLVIWIISNYGRFVSGDLNVIPALLLAYGVPSGILILGAIFEALSNMGGGQGV